MRKLAVNIPTLVVLSLLTFAALPAPARADCTYIYHVDQDPEVFCFPDYYTVLSPSPTPDWCQFSPGDRVYTRWQNINEVLTLTGYYVIPASDTAGRPPSDFTQYPDDVVGGNCNLVWLPW